MRLYASLTRRRVHFGKTPRAIIAVAGDGPYHKLSNTAVRPVPRLSTRPKQTVRSET